MTQAARPIDEEETESERERESSSESDGSEGMARAAARAAKGAERVLEDDSSDESDHEDGAKGGGVRIKAEPGIAPDDSDSESDGSESESENESSDESEQEGAGDSDGGTRVKAESGARAEMSGSESDGCETGYDEEEEEDDDASVEQEEVRDDVMFKEEEEEPDAAAVDDDRDSDYKEEDGDDDEDEDAKEELEEELEEDVEVDPDEDDEGGGNKRARWKCVPERRFDPRRKGRDVPKGERDGVKSVLQHLRSFISSQERTAITRGFRMTGPPIHEPLTSIERLARQFRWPKHLRNVRNTDFAQDPVEIIEDHEVPVTVSQALRHESGSRGRDTSAFAAPPRPLMVSAANALRHGSRKRKRESNDEGEGSKEGNSASPDSTTQDHALSSDAFVTLGRAGNAFSDRYMESLLKANLTELQGIGEQDAYSQRCWTPLPVSRKPVANWRFVFEHLLMNRDARFGEPSDAFWPQMNDSTLQRIRDRLKTVFCATWQSTDDKLFDLMTREGRQVDEIVNEGGAESDQGTTMTDP